MKVNSLFIHQTLFKRLFTFIDLIYIYIYIYIVIIIILCR